MPSILNDADKETVKRFVPKQTNKIQAVAVARLYVAYPNRSRWTYTGLQGAAVLCNDLVGNTFWIKLVDISSGNRGVIWDQEIYDSWNYNQDRVFFHTFELEDCLAGLCFADEKEAKQFKKKMDDREKNASKATRATPFGGSIQSHASGGTSGGGSGHHKHSLLGGIFSSHRHSSAPTPPESPRSYNHNRSGSTNGGGGYGGLPPPSEFATLDAFDPQWREHFGDDLRAKGLTDEFIRENQDFIVDFLPSAAPLGPPPPPRPPKTALDDNNNHNNHNEDVGGHRLFGVPPPFTGQRQVPPPPPRGGGGGGGGGGRVPSPPAPALPSREPSQGKAAVLQDIQSAGGIRALRKVDRSQIRDRSAALVDRSSDTGPHGSGLPPAGVGAGGSGSVVDSMALALALQKRKGKVSQSDDEKEDDDDWD
ncbi:actin associated protein [Niveomyces insectorum RCEF 264]|uniref:Actin associated protein n=1 Tax=Niveomyces insectorum RCEF 264 TaxID=1081102 RepID=A0A167VDI8_9HYPO|nr:actin associated protein [Niveomyces insectorum RCEF 264]